ncbi:hypothetical protein L1987_37713 [Smallanthus sonchifolius]|uniref:Uncharacterized protein n=1 Tax=Smallanthus sonchifolius TaxID=185202 RepID=A0ACB9HGN3_9ASTR|nr:hypothetical protein L1987_37713 [Smallanthus sonchifolius]
MRMPMAPLSLEITFSNVKIQNAIKKSYLLLQESLNLTFQDFDAYDTLHLKDVASMTGDNSTPIIELEKSTSKSLMMNENNSSVRSTHCDLKRNLEDVYQIDESTSLSATKIRANPSRNYNPPSSISDLHFFCRLIDAPDFLASSFSTATGNWPLDTRPDRLSPSLVIQQVLETSA